MQHTITEPWPNESLNSLQKRFFQSFLDLQSFFGLFLVEKMSGQSIFESEADPRIKWALDLMSEDGVESTSVIGHFAYPVASAASMYLARTIRNHQMRRPVFTGFPVTAALIAGSWFLGSFLHF